jgi:hypothetical protein
MATEPATGPPLSLELFRHSYPFAVFERINQETASKNVALLMAIFQSLQQHPPSGLQLTQAVTIQKYFCIATGALFDYEVEFDGFFVGCASCYTAAQVTVTTDGTGQTPNVSGNSRLLPNVIGCVEGTGQNSLGKVRVPVYKGQKLTISINSGPKIVLLAFEAL